MEKIQKHKALDDIPKFLKNLLSYYYIMEFHPNHNPLSFLSMKKYEDLGTHE